MAHRLTILATTVAVAAIVAVAVMSTGVDARAAGPQGGYRSAFANKATRSHRPQAGVGAAAKAHPHPHPHAHHGKSEQRGHPDADSNVSNLRRLFDRMDADRSGHVSTMEMSEHLVRVGSAHANDAVELAQRLPVTLTRFGMPTSYTWEEFSAMYARLDTTYGPMQPHELHLALTGDVTTMRITWVTTDAYTNGPEARYCVASACTANSTVTGTSTTYTVPKRWWGGFNGFIHTAVMTGLTPGQTYLYAVGGTGAAGTEWSGDFHFTAQKSNTPDATTRLAVYGDQGTIVPLGYQVSKQVITDFASVPFDGIMHVGDLSYAGLDSSIKFLNISKADEMTWVWDLWADQNEPLAAYIPYMTGVGNHEVFYNWTAFTHRYHMPYEASNGNGNFWFSYDIGNIHFTSMSTEHPYNPGSPQWTWAKADLAKAAANRDAVPWIIVTGHRPMYCSDADEWSDHRPGAPFQTYVEPLLLEYQVDMVITGHQHCYERIHPVRNGTVVTNATAAGVYQNPLAPVQVVVGTSGAMQWESWIDPQPVWSASRNADNGNSYGYGQLTAWNHTHLEFTFMPLSGVVADRDYFMIVKA